jgi:chromosome segregation ATPase
MKTHASRRLSTLMEEIASSEAELRRLRDRLEAQRAGLEECRLRMLIAETPLADRDLHAAAIGYLRVEEEVRRAERSLASLRDDQRRLGRLLTAAGA